MCGITGYISTKPRDKDKLLSVLHHRGPDDKGSFSKNFGDKECFIAHNRLSIIDLSDNGHQPMQNEDGSIVIAYNGEVYNFRELKIEKLAGEQFKSNTDTEVILKLYQKYGLEMISLLNGDFAIAILDQNRGKLHLIRDRLGVKPLYYHLKERELFFSSEIKGILAAGIKPELNQDLLQQYFVFKYVPQQNTLFKDIKRLAPSHYLSYDLNSGKTEIKKYWSPSIRADYQQLSYGDAQSQLYDLIEKACLRRLVADVPVGTFFSGGLDSSIIAHFLRGRGDIQHYCAAKKEADLKHEGTTSDAKYAKQLADQWGMNLELINIGQEQLTLELIRKTIEFSDDIIADGSQIPSYLITQKAAQKSTVILSGMGADELFLGYAGHLLLAVDQKFDQLPNWLSSLLMKRFAGLQSGKGKFKAYKRYLQKLGNYHQYGNQRYGMYNVVGDVGSAQEIFMETNPSVETLFKSYFPKDQDPFDSLKEFDWNNFLVKNLHYTDRMSMANSVESRVPFLDHEIVEFAYNCPTEYKISSTFKGKRILKDAFRQHLPQDLIDRRKAGFGMPLRSLLSTDAQIDKLLDKDFFNNFTAFSVPGIDNIIKQHTQGSKDNSALIYALITFQEWYKMYIN
jgi:asparagine synthase (glutamine-hydrolysing)